MFAKSFVQHLRCGHSMLVQALDATALSSPGGRVLGFTAPGIPPAILTTHRDAVDMAPPSTPLKLYFLHQESEWRLFHAHDWVIKHT